MHFRFRDLSQPASSAAPAATHKSDATSRRNKRDEELVNRVLYLIIFVLLSLVLRDVYHVHVLRQRIKVNEIYVSAVRSSSEGWITGWKLEELQSKLQTQNVVLKSLVSTLHTPFLAFVGSLRGGASSHRSEAAMARELMAHVENVTAMMTWTCVTRPDTLIRIGQVDFFDSTPENCLLHSAATAVTPSSIFEVLDLGDGYVGFRSFANGKFVKVTPPASGKSSDPWWLDLASPVPGLAERFRLDGPLVYNELLQGHLKCGASGGQGGAAVLGAAGTSPLNIQYKLEHHFQLQPVTGEQVAHARVLKAMAKALRSKSESEISSFQESGRIKLEYESLSAKEKVSQHEAKIAILIPVTSKATKMSSVRDSPFFKNTLSSFLTSIDWQSNQRFSFTFFLGFDQGDALYDTGDAWSDMRQGFNDHVHGFLADAYASSPASLRQHVASQISLRLRHFTDKEGSPSQVVSALAREAYDSQFDYFFQVNDDTIFKSRDWPTIFTNTLADSPLHVNLGVTGPFDINNLRILTHAFVHRTHLDIFDGRFFPQPFKNWWSDDWISAVYGRYGTFRAHGVQVLHNVHAQKQGNTVQRYKVDEAARDRLRAEVLHGFTKVGGHHIRENSTPITTLSLGQQVNAFLVSKGRPRLPLPEVCGYVPLAELVYDYLRPPAAPVVPQASSGRRAVDHGSVESSNRATGSGEISRRGVAGRREEKEDLVQYEVQNNAAKGREPRGRHLVDMPIWGQDECASKKRGQEEKAEASKKVKIEEDPVSAPKTWFVKLGVKKSTHARSCGKEQAAKLEQQQEEEVQQAASEAKLAVRFKFQAGFTNAIRRPVYLKDLL